MTEHRLIYYAERYARAREAVARAKGNFTSYERLTAAIRKRDVAEREMRTVLGAAQKALNKESNHD